MQERAADSSLIERKASIENSPDRDAVVPAQWIVCQIGAREHYATARMLEASGRLRALVTDIWVSPSGLSKRLPQRLRGRFNAELSGANVLAPTLRSTLDLLAHKGHITSHGRTLIAANRRFQHRAASLLRGVESESSRTILFSYSYAARHLFELAKERGWKTVLGQIDPGPTEERIVGQLPDKAGTNRASWKPADPEYWQSWRIETTLADRIIVNSEWSRKALLGEGVPASKIVVIPLSYQASSQSLRFERTYPETFDRRRPLRVLFLGQIGLRKGVHVIFDACREMRDLAVEFWFVGPIQLPLPADLQGSANIRWVGPVTRNAVDEFYQTADIFLFPTFSDGFGLTQLEAQSWKLPIVSSRACGDVVIDGHNGYLLDEPSGQMLAGILRGILEKPSILQRMSANSGIESRFIPASIAAALAEVEKELLG